jgi:hypothetical protein
MYIPKGSYSIGEMDVQVSYQLHSAFTEHGAPSGAERRGECPRFFHQSVI